MQSSCIAELPLAFEQLQDLMLRKPDSDREMADILALVLSHVTLRACLQHDEKAVLFGVVKALAEGVATKTHVLNRPHRLIDGKTIGGPDIDTPQSLALRREPKAMSNAMMAHGLGPPEAAMHHDPTGSAAVIMLSSLKMHGMARFGRFCGFDRHL